MHTYDMQASSSMYTLCTYTNTHTHHMHVHGMSMYMYFIYTLYILSAVTTEGIWEGKEGTEEEGGGG